MNLVPALAERPERVAVVHQLTQKAFAPYTALGRPGRVLAETVDDVAADLDAGGGLIAYDDTWSEPLGALRWRVRDGHLWVKRVAVAPTAQRSGVGTFLMDACRGIASAHGVSELRLGVWDALPPNRAWYERRGMTVAAVHDDWTELRVEVRPFAHARPGRLVKYEWFDDVQAELVVDVLEDTPLGVWVGAPRFTPLLRDGRVVWVNPRPVVTFLPAGRWWAAAWGPAGNLQLKVDICTPFERPDTETIAFRDLCLDVVVSDDGPATVVDEDEFGEHLPGGGGVPYPVEIADGAQRAATEVLRMVHAGEEPFGREGPRRLEEYAARVT